MVERFRSVRQNRVLLAMVGLMAVSLFLRLWRLDAQCATRDECFSWRLIQYPIMEQVSRTAADVHPPLYYLLLTVWSHVFGLSMFSLRAFSILINLATVPVIYITIAASIRWYTNGPLRSKGKLASLFGAAYFALHPVQIEAARTARMYSLGVFLTAVSTWLLVRAVSAQTSARRRWMAYGICSAALWYTHYFGFFVTASQLLFAGGWVVWNLFRRDPHAVHSALNVVLAGAIINLIYAVWLPAQLNQMEEVNAGYWIPRPDWADLREALFTWSSGLERGSIVEMSSWGIVAAAIILISVWRGTGLGIFWFVQAVTAWIATIAISWSGNSPIFQPRYMVFSHVAWIGLASVAIAVTRSLIAVVVLAWLCASVCVLAAWEQAIDRPAAQLGVVCALESVMEQSSGSTIVWTSWWGELNRVKYYAWALGASNVHVRCRAPKDGGVGHQVHVASLTDDDFATTDQIIDRTNSFWLIDRGHGTHFADESEVTRAGTETFGTFDDAWTVVRFVVDDPMDRPEAK